MKPAEFEYFAPHSVGEALELLQRHGDRAKIIAGGQSLVPMMNFRLARPEVLVDINRIRDLDYIRQQDGTLAIGAITRQRDVELSPLVAQHCPLLREALSFVAHAAIRNRGTIGGSLVHADPAAEIATVLMALDGSVVVASADGESVLTPGEFFLTYLTTSLEPTDLLVEARFPLLAPNGVWAFVEMSRRHGDFAMVAVAAIVEMGEDGVCTEARIALGGVAPTPVRATAAEDLLQGRELTPALSQEAGMLAREICETESDYHGSAAYRENLAGVLTGQCLAQALQRYNVTHEEQRP